MADNEGFRNDWATKDFYQVLGVAKDASQDDIKKAYRKLARANHPDSNPGDDAKHETFKAVAEAYDVIGDEAKRAKYDEFRSLQARGGFWNLGDHSSAEEINAELGVSKRTFKASLGALLKKRQIKIEAKGIRLVK